MPQNRPAPQIRLTLFQRLSLFFYDRPRLAILLWLLVFAFGIASYSTLLKREGFPSVQIPFSAVSGAYLVNDPAKVDADLAKPLSDIALKQPQVKTVQSSAQANFFNLFVQYQTGTLPDEATKRLDQAIKTAGIVPAEVELKVETPRFGITERGDDVVISFYATNPAATTSELAAAADQAVKELKNPKLPLVQDVSIINPFVAGVDPATGQQTVRQTGFDRYAVRQNGQTRFYNSVIIGMTARPGADILELDKQVRSAVAKLNQQVGADGYRLEVSATFADDIRSQISELQKALLEGLAAVLIVGTIIIALRASLIIILSMISVLAIAVGVLYAVDYSLNTITLFALILGLALIVDDTIIMTEAIDAQRRRFKSGREAVKVAGRRVTRAMVAATATAALSFAPLLFVGGILGSFIRAIPVTIIISLLTSLVVALVFIPRFARSLLLTKSQLGKSGQPEFAEAAEAAIARLLARPMLWAKQSRRRLAALGATAVIVGFGFIGAGGWLFQKVTFNIFPPTKDSNGLIVGLNFPPDTSIDRAQQVARRAEAVVIDRLGENFVQASYYGSGSNRTASLFIDILPYEKRAVRAPQLAQQLTAAFKNFEGAQAKVSQVDVGPPASSFAVRIQTEDQSAAYRLADDIRSFLDGRRLKRASGQIATVTRTNVSNPAALNRADGVRYVEVSAEFDGDDTTTLVTLARNAIEKQFDAAKLAGYGLNEKVLDFDFGQETENQESFQTLALAFPALMLAIYLLLAFQFRSLLQPLLIFVAIPFSLFGITLGLYVSDNAFSFFAMLGFFALIGLSLKNTILLTDYANQARQSGKGAIDAAVLALEERFRPLIATSLTAIIALVPLGLMSPFWEGLVVVLVFGLLSSTLLVITVFPYYYLGAEYLRMRIGRAAALGWLALAGASTGVLMAAGFGVVALLAIPLSAVALGAYGHFKRR